MQPKGLGPFASLTIFVLLLASAITLFNFNQAPAEEQALSQFVNDVESGQVISISVSDSRINYELADETRYFSIKEYSQSINEVLADVDQSLIDPIEIKVVDTSGRDIWLNILLSFVPIILIVGFLFFMMRGASNSNNQAMSFGKSRARLHDKEKSKTTFKDVAGVEEAKDELTEVVDFLKHPSKYASMGAEIPKGVMLVGAPGTGKTLLARAVAGEANVPFFSISGSEFVEMFVGVGASRVRDLFKKAKRNAPCIIFIDEIDAVGRKRGAGLGGGHDEREQTLNQILTEMDGFEQDTNVIIMAATNRPDVLDPALLRPGRFDRRVVVDKPTREGRNEILQIHTRNKPMDKEVKLKELADMTPGLTGADLKNLVNEAAIFAARNDKKKINMHDLEMAFEKVALGRERRSLVLTEEQKKKTAYHEMGHAIIGHTLSGCDPIQKVTIIPRGMALGVTWSRPEKENVSSTQEEFEHRMAMALGGYVAEEMIYGVVTTGPGNDLEKVSQIARNMVTRYGMSPLGPFAIGDNNNEVFLGRDFGHTKNYSEELAKKVDEEVQKLVKKSYELAKSILEKHKKKFEEMSQVLLERETLSAQEFVDLFDGKPLKAKAA